MEFFELMDISHRYLEVLNPSSPEKVIRAGKILDLQPGSTVLDFGSGTGETLVLWAEKFGISGTGVDISSRFCERALTKIAEHGLSDCIKIINGPGNEYIPDKPDFDVAACIGATFIWNGYRSAIRAMQRYVKPGAKLVIGEAHWLKEEIPAEYLEGNAPPGTMTEFELLQATLEEGYEIEYILRSSLDDWDRYNSGTWHGLLRWIAENPDHPDRKQVLDHLHTDQENYLKYEREYLGWAIYILSPAT